MTCERYRVVVREKASERERKTAYMFVWVCMRVCVYVRSCLRVYGLFPKRNLNVESETLFFLLRVCVCVCVSSCVSCVCVCASRPPCCSTPTNCMLQSAKQIFINPSLLFPAAVVPPSSSSHCIQQPSRSTAYTLLVRRPPARGTGHT